MFLRPLSFALALMVLFSLTPASAFAQDEPVPSPVKIYILAGQSNMQGKGGIEGDGGNTLRSLVKNDAKKQFQSLVNEDGEWVVRDDVWIHYDLHPWRDLRHGSLKPGYGSSDGQIGPELGFGHAMGDASDGQVLLIKVAWGGKSLGHDFAPPSIGKYTGYPEVGELGYYYTRLVEVVNLVTADIETFFPDYQGQGVEIAGFGWHQGWNDQYGDGNAENYERNMAAFIKDIRSAEHGFGVPNLPFVIATSGMIDADSPIVKGQLAMSDAQKYPEFAGNVAVVDTHQPYGPDKMGFKFDKDGKPTDEVGYHWNSNARSYFNIGRAIAWEMQKLEEPKLPARLAASAKAEGVRLNWQLGSETPESVALRRNGKRLDAKLKPTQTEFIDTGALPGLNEYELIVAMPSGEEKLSASCDTSPTDLTGYRSLDGVVLNWEARGKYEGFILKRDGKVIADDIAADARSFQDTEAPEKGKVSYAIMPKRGEPTPAALDLNLGPVTAANAGGALIYEPFDYAAGVGEPQTLIGKSGALGTQGAYVYTGDKPERALVAVARGLSYGELPVNGNRSANHRWSKPIYIELDDSLKNAGLLEDGATLWMSYIFAVGGSVFPDEELGVYDGRGSVTLRSEDMQLGIGLQAHRGQHETVVVREGELSRVRIAGARSNTPTLVVARMTWGKDGAPDSLVPFSGIGSDLKLPESEGRHFNPPFDIDQSKLSRLVFDGGGQFDEIRFGPTYESVVGGGEQNKK